jgi:uncharacterized protein YndB with AHSA1/START domain
LRNHWLHVIKEVIEVVPNQIERETLIDAPLDVVWGVVTEPAQITRWFSDAAQLDLRPGGEGMLSWEQHGPVQLRVERVERPHLFSFRWMYPQGSEPLEGNSMLVEFTLSDEGGKTRLRVVESGLAAVDWAEEEKAKYLDSHSRGWERHIGELDRYMAAQREAATRR